MRRLMQVIAVGWILPSGVVLAAEAGATSSCALIQGGLSGVASVAALRAAPLPDPVERFRERWAENIRGLLPMDGARVHMCFADDTDPDIVAAFCEDFPELCLGAEAEGDLRYQGNSQWPVGQGNPLSLTWSFVPDGVGDSTLFAGMDAKFGGNRALWMSLFEQSFARWETLTGVTYTRVTFAGNDWDDGASWGSSGGNTRGDVRIRMISIDGGSGILAFNSFPTNSDMSLDSAEGWASGSPSYRYLRNVIMHEHGHGLGMEHVCPLLGARLMEPFINLSFDGPQHDDIRGGQRRYGDLFEPNNSAGAAADLGTIPFGSPVEIGSVPAPLPREESSLISIDANGEQDWFQFNVDGGAAVTVNVTPLGLNYEDSPQSCSGQANCCSGSFTNSLEQANLNLELIDRDGSTVLASAISRPIGLPETISNVLLGAAGDYFVKVSETGSVSGTQLYSMTITAQNTDCNENGILDRCDLDCGLPECAVAGCGQSNDCNGNSFPDECDNDCNEDGLADECAVVSDPTDTFVCAGGTAHFTAGASDPSFTYQWTMGGVPLADDGRMTGTATSQLTITNVGEGDIGEYACQIFDGCMLAETALASLSLVEEGSFSRQPEALRTICAGFTASFTVEVTGAVPPPTYLWHRDGEPLANGGKYSGVDTTTLMITNAGTEDEGSYTCMISSGCVEQESDPGVLQIGSPIFLSQPQDVCVNNGQEALFSVEVTTPLPTLGYQWKRNGSALSDGGNISGASTDTLTIGNVGAQDAGTYSVLVFTLPTPVCLEDSDTAELTVDGCTACAVAGDQDGDGDVDLADLAEFALCFGADATVRVECVCANLNASNDFIDLDDWLEMEPLISGP